MSRLVILAASVFEISCGKRTDKRTNADENPTKITAVGVGKYNLIITRRVAVYISSKSVHFRRSNSRMLEHRFLPLRVGTSIY